MLVYGKIWREDILHFHSLYVIVYAMLGIQFCKNFISMKEYSKKIKHHIIKYVQEFKEQQQFFLEQT